MRYSRFGSNCYSEKMEQSGPFKQSFWKIIYKNRFYDGISYYQIQNILYQTLASINKMISRK